MSVGLKSILFFTLFLSCHILYAQTSQNGTIKLKSGMTMSGEITEVSYEEYVKIKFVGEEVTISWEDIESLEVKPANAVSQNPATNYYGRRPRRLPQPYKTNSPYFTIDMANRFGYNPWVVMNPGFSIGAGYNLDEHLSVGGTIGSDFYWGNNSNVFPTGIEGSYRFNEKGFSPQFKLRTGYNFAQGRPTWWGNQLEVTEGGVFINPSIGFISKKRDHFGWYVNLNTMIANVTEEGVDNIFDGQQWITIPIRVERNLVRTGFTFGFYFD